MNMLRIKRGKIPLVRIDANMLFLSRIVVDYFVLFNQRHNCFRSGLLPSLFWGAALLLYPTLVWSSPFQIYGFGARGIATAGARTATTDSYHAVFYNPAGLMRGSNASVGFGAMAIAPSVTVQQARSDSPYPAITPKSNAGVLLGANLKPGGIFKDRIALGFGLYQPVVRPSRLEALDPRTPQAYYYQNLPDSLGFGLSAAVRLHDWVDLGVGLQMIAGFDGSGFVDISPSLNQVSHRSLRVDFVRRYAPTVGLAIHPTSTLDIGIAYRGSLAFSYAIPLDVHLEDSAVVKLEARGTSKWTPDIVDVGIAMQLPFARLALTVSYERWSAAPSPNGLFTTSVSSSSAERAGEEPALSTTPIPVDLGASDIIVPKVAYEMTIDRAWAVRLGYAYRPTPLPEPRGAVNYLDTSAHVLGAGASFQTAADPPLTIDAGIQWQYLVPRGIPKDDPADPVGNLNFSGNLLVGSVEIRHQF